MMSAIQIHWANLSELDAIVPLFDAYRQFYEKPSAVQLSRDLLNTRMATSQSRIILATDESGNACGFAQLYPLFSSLSMSVLESKVWLLNDLYVAQTARGQGVGAALLSFVQDWAAQEGAGYLMLETAKTNATAQRLYEAQGWVRDEAFFVYQFAL